MKKRVKVSVYRVEEKDQYGCDACGATIIETDRTPGSGVMLYDIFPEGAAVMTLFKDDEFHLCAGCAAQFVHDFGVSRETLEG